MRGDDARALAVGRALLAVLEVLGAGTGAPAVYTQDALPPGVTRRAFIDRHRARVRAGIAGWSRAGRARVVTAAAWGEDVAAETNRARMRRAPPRLEVVRDDGDKLEQALGIRVRRGAK